MRKKFMKPGKQEQVIGSSQGNGETLQRVHYVVHPRAENDETGKLVNAAVIRLSPDAFYKVITKPSIKQ
jgi:hypothetical protein